MSARLTRCDSSCRSAFTLLEVILAISLLVLLSSAMLGFLWQIGDRRMAISEATRHAQGVTLLFERIEADLTGGLVADRSGSAGISGRGDSLRLLSRGVWVAAGGSDRTEALRRAHVDLQGTEYTFDERAGRVGVRRWVVGPDGTGSAAEQSGTAMDGVRRLRFRYFDGDEWKDEFDSAAAGRLPAAIEIAVWFGEPPAPDPADLPVDEFGSASEPDPALFPDEAGGASFAEFPEEDEILHPPDRVRVLSVPDGPSSAWDTGGVGGGT